MCTLPRYFKGNRAATVRTTLAAAVQQQHSSINPSRIGLRDSRGVLFVPGAPGGLVGGPRAYQDQLCGFKPHRTHGRRDFFWHKTLISGKRESVS